MKHSPPTAVSPFRRLPGSEAPPLAASSTRGILVALDRPLRSLLVAVACLLAPWSVGPVSASGSWEEECATAPAMPELEQVVAPVPQAGTWRGKGFGDKRKLDVEIEDCGRTITGMAGVKLKHVADTSIPLELDEDDGRYKASFTYTEGGVTAVVTWDLEVESESRLTGRMTIMGRGDRVEYELLEARPSPGLASCECEAIRDHREDLSARLEERRQSSQSRERADATRGWTVHPESCAIEPIATDRKLPTQASFEASMRAGWQGTLVHRERCCAVERDGAEASQTRAATYAEWLGAMPEEAASDEMESLGVQIDALDAWLQQRCE